MPSFTTIYRAIVMLAAGVIIFKGWQVYGPPTEKVKAFAVRALEVAQTSLSGNQPRSASVADDPRIGVQAASPSPAPQGSAPQTPPPLLATDTNAISGATTLIPAQPADAPADAIHPAAALVPDEPAAAADAIESASERMPLLLARLEELGAAEPQLAAWGSSGQMYRFCCRAALAESPAFARHFEAVAAEPVAAVEQVVAKVEAWRTEQQQRTALR